MTAPSSEPQKVAIVTGASRGIGAGIASRSPTTRPNDYAAMTAVNLAGFFYITQRAVRQMVAIRAVATS